MWSLKIHSRTSGFFSASHAASGANCAKIGAQTGSARLSRSYAKPMVGVCETAMPPTMRAMRAVYNFAVRMIRAVILDLDGTLLDTAGEITDAMDRTLDELGFKRVPAQEIQAMIGRGVPKLVERVIRRTGATGIDPARM